MTQTFNIINIFGKWNIDVDTPFGKEKYTLNIDTFGPLKGSGFYLDYDGLQGSIEHDKASIAFTGAKFEGTTFFCSVETDFPIKSSISITANLVEDNKITGMIEVGQYLITSFVGVK
jgi:hypothetical protein